MSPLSDLDSVFPSNRKENWEKMERVRPGSTFIYLFLTHLPSLCYMPNTVLVLGKT